MPTVRNNQKKVVKLLRCINYDARCETYVNGHPFNFAQSVNFELSVAVTITGVLVCGHQTADLSLATM